MLGLDFTAASYAENESESDAPSRGETVTQTEQNREYSVS
jgi:hypothetical protein